MVMSTSARVNIVTMEGIPVDVVGPTTPAPASIDPAHPDLTWPTNQISMYSSVLMDDGSRWTVLPSPRRTSAGGIVISLTSPSRVLTTYTVPRYGLDVPMWFVGELPPPPPVDEPIGDTGEPIPDVPMDDGEGLSETT